MALNRLQKELKQLNSDASEQWNAGPNDEDFFHWTGTLIGPKDTPYEGGIFFISFIFTTDYPFKPPKVLFKTRIYHCNIGSDGGICLDSISKGWSPSITIAKIMEHIYSLLVSPDSDHPLVAEIAIVYRNNKEIYDATAREWTRLHAS